MKHFPNALKGILLLFIFIQPLSAANRLTMSLDLRSGANMEFAAAELEQEYRRSLFSDLKYLFKAPFHWKKKELVAAAVVTGAAAALYLNDAKIMKFVQSHRSGLTDGIAGVVERFGNPRTLAPGLAVLYLYSRLFRDRRAENIALLAAKSAVVTGLTVFMIKILAHRHRPDEGDGKPNRWDGPKLSFKNLSFCSGHSATAFSLAAVIATKLKTPAAGILAYGTAALTALSRINDKRHWASDVLVGSVIGYVIGRRIARRKKPTGEATYRKPQSIPLLVFPRAGITVGLQL